MKKKVYWIGEEHDEAVKKVAKKEKSTESNVVRNLVEKLETFNKKQMKKLIVIAIISLMLPVSFIHAEEAVISTQDNDVATPAIVSSTPINGTISPVNPVTPPPAPQSNQGFSSSSGGMDPEFQLKGLLEKVVVLLQIKLDLLTQILAK